MDRQEMIDNGGVLIIDLKGTTLSSEDKDLLSNPAIAGVLFFARNYEDRQQLTSLVAEIRAIRPGLILMVDQEGGRVQRFRQGFTRLPAAGAYARYFNCDPEGALALIKDAGWLMAQELLSFDIDLSLAPVVDIHLGLTEIVGNRAFGSDADTVIKLASCWVEGVREAGMATVCKHFPGHGSVNADSHLALPVDDRPMVEIESRDLRPFKALIEKNVQGVMPAHILFPEVDDQPAGFSSVWLKTVLREQLGFSGVVISDCLTMEGAASAGGYPVRVEKALSAGCDLLLLSSRDGVKQVLSDFSWPLNDPAHLLPLKHNGTVSYDELQSMNRYLSCKDRLDYLLRRFNEEQ